jgi:CDP-2,3-bis-(O-geranylgeranyl)-sn-glycerol synthase
MMYFQFLFLILVANGAPLLGHVVLRNHWAYPLDFGLTFFDGNPLLGRSKTIRGVGLSIFMTMLCAPLIGVSARTGLVVSMAAMFGDCLASFSKRRFGMKSESQAFGLDQVPESLFPLLALQSTYPLELWGILFTVVAFVILELILSRVLFYFHLRKHPY